MPLIGLVDPSHAERKDNLPGRLPRWAPAEDILAQAATAPPKWSPWNWEMLSAALAEWQERDYISTTMLTGGCPRSKVLERKEDFILTFDSMYAALRGTQVHRTLEYGARPGAVAEARFQTKVYVPGQGDIALSCSPDLITQNPNTLQDWKVTENPPAYDYPWPDHKLQVQFNRFIVNAAESWTKQGQPFDIPFRPFDFEFEHLVLVYLGPKGPKPLEVMASRRVHTPTGKEINRRFPDVWDDEKVLAELLPRLEAMVVALESYPDFPQDPLSNGQTVAEVWGGPPTWQCPGPPLCFLPACLAKRYPAGLVWESPK